MVRYSAAVNIRFLERGVCVDAPMVVKIQDGKVVIRDYRKLFSHPIYKVIDPVEVSVYEQRKKTVVTLNNGDVITLKGDVSVWNMFVRDRDGELTMMRMRSKRDGVMGEKRINALIRLNQKDAK